MKQPNVYTYIFPERKESKLGRSNIWRSKFPRLLIAAKTNRGSSEKHQTEYIQKHEQTTHTP